MPSCPACLGDGQHDHRDDDAFIGETWTDEEIARAKEAGMIYPVGIVACYECEGTGVVSEERLRDLHAYSVSVIDQALARIAGMIEALDSPQASP